MTILNYFCYHYLYLIITTTDYCPNASTQVTLVTVDQITSFIRVIYITDNRSYSLLYFSASTITETEQVSISIHT